MAMNGFIDRWPTWARDLLVGVAAVLAGWVVTDVVPLLPHNGPWALAGPVLVVLAGAVTKWTQAYGRGAADHTPRELMGGGGTNG